MHYSQPLRWGLFSLSVTVSIPKAKAFLLATSTDKYHHSIKFIVVPLVHVRPAAVQQWRRLKNGLRLVLKQKCKRKCKCR